MLEWITYFQIPYIFRMIVACVCGVIIGIERKNRAKKAGVRTHCVVACAAALMMIVSKYAFYDVLKDHISLDPSRVAAGIISGIGFLGAGMIFVHKNNISGLTTAAGVWATTGIGMAIGAGMYVVGLAATVILLLAQIIFHSNFWLFREPRMKKLTVRAVTDPDFHEKTVQALTALGISIYDINIKKNAAQNEMEYEFVLEIPNDTAGEKILGLFTTDCSLVRKSDID